VTDTERGKRDKFGTGGVGVRWGGAAYRRGVPTRSDDRKKGNLRKEKKRIGRVEHSGFL